MRSDLNIKVVMLAEGIRPAPLELQVGLPAPLLPVKSDLRLLDEWSRVLRLGGLASSPIEVVMASRSGFQSMESIANDDRYSRTIEPRSHRGTAGVLADLWRGRFAEDSLDYLIVIDGGICPPPSVVGLAEVMQESSDIIIGASEIDRYAGVIALKPEILSAVPDRGYHDFKEQSLPVMFESGKSISAVAIIPRAIRVRNLESWLDAVRSVSIGASNSVGDVHGGRIEGHCCVASTASIEGGLIKNSVIMDGAVVEPGAIVARSVILPGQRVPKDAQIIDSIVGMYGMATTRSSER